MVSAIVPFGWDLQTEDLFELQDLLLVSVTGGSSKGNSDLVQVHLEVLDPQPFQRSYPLTPLEKQLLVC